MKVQIAKGKPTEKLIQYFAKHGYQINISKAKPSHGRRPGLRYVKFKVEREKLFFLLAHGECGEDFIDRFEIVTGIRCTVGLRW